MAFGRGFVWTGILIGVSLALAIVGTVYVTTLRQSSSHEHIVFDEPVQQGNPVAPADTSPTAPASVTQRDTDIQAPKSNSSSNATDCPNTYPQGHVDTSAAVTIEANPDNKFSIAQGERTPEAGFAAFKELLALIAQKNGTGKQAEKDSIIVSLQALNDCRVNQLVNATVTGGDTQWAANLLSLNFLHLTKTEKESLIGVVAHSNDALAARLILAQYKNDLSSSDAQALQTIVSKYGGPAHEATQSSSLLPYASATYSFSLQYPSDLTTYTDGSSDSRVFRAFDDPRIQSTTIFAAVDKTTGGSIMFGVSTDPDELKKCLTAPQSEAGGATITHVANTTIGGRPFLGFDSSAELLGLIVVEHDYRSLNNGTCFGIRVVPPVDQTDLIAMLQKESSLSAQQQAMLQQAQQAQASAPHVKAELDALFQAVRFDSAQ